MHFETFVWVGERISQLSLLLRTRISSSLNLVSNILTNSCFCCHKNKNMSRNDSISRNRLVSIPCHRYIFTHPPADAVTLSTELAMGAELPATQLSTSFFGKWRGGVTCHTDVEFSVWSFAFVNWPSSWFCCIVSWPRSPLDPAKAIITSAWNAMNSLWLECDIHLNYNSIDWREERVPVRTLAPKGMDYEIPYRLEERLPVRTLAPKGVLYCEIPHWLGRNECQRGR